MPAETARIQTAICSNCGSHECSKGQKRGPSRALPPGLLGGVPARNAREMGIVRRSLVSPPLFRRHTQSYGRRPQCRDPGALCALPTFVFGEFLSQDGRAPAAPIPYLQNTTACRLEPLSRLRGGHGWLLTQGPGGCCNPESRYHMSDAIRRRPGRSSFVSSKNQGLLDGWELAGARSSDRRQQSEYNLRRVPCRGPIARQIAATGGAPTIESTLEDKEARSGATTGPSGRQTGQNHPPGRLPQNPLRCRSPLRAGSSCIRVCKYPDAHASRRRTETWTESCMRPSETLPLGGTLSPRTPARP